MSRILARLGAWDGELADPEALARRVAVVLRARPLKHGEIAAIVFGDKGFV